jgi:3-hydroxyacyl-CoA dehydrogenase
LQFRQNGLKEPSLETKQKNNTIHYTDIKDGAVGADLVVEAATENVELKLNIFKQLNDACSHKLFWRQIHLRYP